MNRLAVSILMALSLPAALSGATRETRVSGRVYDSVSGTPLAGVAVSDGVNLVRTGKDGKYALKLSSPDSLVFVSLPSGYKAPCDGVVPRFYSRVDGGQDVYDFPLLPMDMTRPVRILMFNDIHLQSSGNDLLYCNSVIIPDFIARKAAWDGEVMMVCLGDMSTDKWWYKNGRALPEYLSEIARCGIPVFHILGNHDHDIRGGTTDHDREDAYRRLFGPTNYSMDIGGTHWVMMDSFVSYGPVEENGEADYRKTRAEITPVQMKWLRKDLARIPFDMPLVVCLHGPLFNPDGTVKYGEDLVDLISMYADVTVFTAHTHYNRNIQARPNIFEHNNIGSSSWHFYNDTGVNMARDGVPMGYLECSVDGPSLRWHYSPYGKPWEENQFRVYDLNCVPEEYGGKPGENKVLVNVFNWDPAWRISVTEEGGLRPVRLVKVYDPLYSALIAGTSSEGYKNLLPIKLTNHILEVSAASPSSTLHIEVTDRFGNVFKQDFHRPATFSRHE